MKEEDMRKGSEKEGRRCRRNNAKTRESWRLAGKSILGGVEKAAKSGQKIAVGERKNFLISRQ